MITMIRELTGPALCALFEVATGPEDTDSRRAARKVLDEYGLATDPRG